MDFQTAKQYDDEYIIHSYGRFPVLLTKGKGKQTKIWLG